MAVYTNDALYQTLSEMEVLNKSQLDTVYKSSKSSNGDLGEMLIARDLINDANLGQIIAEMAGVPYINLTQVAIPKEVLRVIPEIVARKQRLIVYGDDKDGLKIAMADPSNEEIKKFISKKTGKAVTVAYATDRDIEMNLGRYKRDLQKTFDEMLAEKVSAAGKGKNETPIIEMVNLLIEYAYSNRSSDIHTEPEENFALIRFRIDGVLHDVLTLPTPIYEQVVTRIKVGSKLRTDEHMSAQDGKMQVKLPEEKLDIRVSIVPVVHGEKIVMRLLSSKSRSFGLQDLGMSAEDLKKVRNGFEKPYGMVLSTGPTGSGKSTTIYAILKILNVREINIATIEDPVEYDIAGVNQIQVNPKTNLTFADGLRAILRQDPNVIFVGEIRDAETADIAVNSAMTGHLVVSTLHTNDAATTLPRLIDMGVEPFLVASTVNVIIGQRLVRKICEKCRVSEEAHAEEMAKHYPEAEIKKFFGKNKTMRIYHGKGCEVCQETGYAGRIGVFEILEVSDKIREMITAKVDSDVIKNQAIKEGMRTMLDDGLEKVRTGITTIQEVMRATRE